METVTICDLVSRVHVGSEREETDTAEERMKKGGREGERERERETALCGHRHCLKALHRAQGLSTLEQAHGDVCKERLLRAERTLTEPPPGTGLSASP